jgi:hypothetical protein
MGRELHSLARRRKVTPRDFGQPNEVGLLPRPRLSRADAASRRRAMRGGLTASVPSRRLLFRDALPTARQERRGPAI